MLFRLYFLAVLFFYSYFKNLFRVMLTTEYKRKHKKAMFSNLKRRPIFSILHFNDYTLVC